MGAAKGTLRADQTNFKKKGTGNPVLINKKEGKSIKNDTCQCTLRLTTQKKQTFLKDVNSKFILTFWVGQLHAYHTAKIRNETQISPIALQIVIQIVFQHVYVRKTGQDMQWSIEMGPC